MQKMANSDFFSALLQERGVKPTANRIVVVKALSGIDRPMSLSELEEKIITIDKSGIFRALSLFRECGLVHVIDDGEGTKYELCRSRQHSHDDDTHVHFHCEKCLTTYCLEEISIPSVVLPEGYVSQTANYIVKGLCPRCSRR